MGKKNGVRLTAGISVILGIILVGIALVIWNFYNIGFWAEVMSEFFAIGFALVGAGLLLFLGIKVAG